MPIERGSRIQQYDRNAKAHLVFQSIIIIVVYHYRLVVVVLLRGGLAVRHGPAAHLRSIKFNRGFKRVLQLKGVSKGFQKGPTITTQRGFKGVLEIQQVFQKGPTTMGPAPPLLDGSATLR
jgi:hypothetical protein